MKPPRIGRPPIPKKERKAVLLSVRLTAAEHRIIERAAKVAGVGLSEWARRLLLGAAVQPSKEVDAPTESTSSADS